MGPNLYAWRGQKRPTAKRGSDGHRYPPVGTKRGVSVPLTILFDGRPRHETSPARHIVTGRRRELAVSLLPRPCVERPPIFELDRIITPRYSSRIVNFTGGEMRGAQGIGGRITVRRMELDWTQSKLAEVMKVRASTVCMWESGKRRPEFAMLPGLRKALRLKTLDWLVEGRCG